MSVENPRHFVYEYEIYMKYIIFVYEYALILHVTLALTLGSVRTEVVRFVGCGGLATILAPGRGTYGLVRSAAFQG